MSKDEDSERRTHAFNIRVADDAREKLRTRQSEVSGVKIWSNRSAEKRGSVSSKLRHELERDFTVPGTPSKLGCPFAVPGGDIVSLGQRSLPTPKSSAASRISGSASGRRRSSLLDPIKGEICGNNPMSPAVSEHGSSALCPIRFMDQHSPEEVAEYFEKHKHQIPRSHEVCIKRYQSNSESIRQLDAKYGNLVSMIQGLGEKHQPILAEKEPDVDEEEDSKNDSVNKWATAVSASLRDEDIRANAGEETEDRKPHFDRPLKEIRVGESPSRPWGITVPAKYHAVDSAASDGSAVTASPQELSAPHPVGNVDGDANAETPARKCPFDHTKFTAQATKPSTEPLPRHGAPVFINAPAQDNVRSAKVGASQPQMLFSGPVFIGYPIDQAIRLMQETGLGSKDRA